MTQINTLHRGGRRYELNDITSLSDDYYPSSISNYILDYDVAAMGLTNGASLSSITDMSGNGRNLSGGVAPTNVISATELGGRPYASFTGAQYLASSSSSTVLSQPAHFFVIAKWNTSTNLNRFLFDGYTSTQARMIFMQVGGQTTVAVGGNTYGITGNWPWTTTSTLWYLWEVEFNGASSAIINTGVSLITGNLGTEGCYGFTFGSRCDGVPATYGWYGGIARIVAYNKIVTGTELTNLRSYFQSSYGITT
jgi:hypothetical protein